MNTLDSYSPRPQGWLVWFLRGILFLGALILLGRLFELQIIKGAYFKSLADNNRIKRILIPAPRGKIIARDGEVIVDNNKDGTRNYVLGNLAGHLTGYLSESKEDEVFKVDANCPDKGARKLGSLVGRGGLEQQYECKLRGIDGEELVEVDAKGNPIRTLGTVKPTSGEDLKTTIDYGLQKKSAMSMGDKKGAIVVTNPVGEILALYSSPSFDPNIFIKKDSRKITQALTDNALPMFDRAVNGLYHPGSIFKIVTSVAALEDGKIDASFTYNDTGIIKIGDFSYTNWFFTQDGRTEGVIDLPRAIARSTDTFFYKVGELVGVDRLAYWANKFNLGNKTGVDLPDDTAGLIPTPAWKRQVKGELWFLGNTYHMAIGQGDVAVSPLAANMIVSVMANSGEVCKPHLTGGENCTNLNLKKENMDLIKKGMIGACSKGGTAYPFFDFVPQVACKTGTAETGEKDKTHAWFAAYAPASDPKIVIDVLVEKGGEGSVVAAPIAKDVLTFWNNRK